MILDTSVADVGCAGSMTMGADTWGFSATGAICSALGKANLGPEAAAENGTWVIASVEAGTDATSGILSAG